MMIRNKTIIMKNLKLTLKINYNNMNKKIIIILINTKN